MKEVIEEAIKLGICNEWAEKMKTFKNFKPFVKMYFDGADWSGKNDFPRRELLSKIKAKIEPYYMFFDNNSIDVKNIEEVAVLGQSEAVMSYDDYNVGQVIVRHNSTAKITTKGNAKVFVTLMDNAKVDVDAKDESFVKIYNYSKNANYKISGRCIAEFKQWD